MGRARCDQSGNRPCHRSAIRQQLAMRPAHGNAQLCSGVFRPRLEILEDRVYPGDTLLGMWALGLLGPGSASSNRAVASNRALIGGEWQHGESSLNDVDALSA